MHYDPEITTALKRVGRSGVPTYVVFPAHDDRAAHVLPELLTRGIVLDAGRPAPEASFYVSRFLTWAAAKWIARNSPSGGMILEGKSGLIDA